MVSALALGIGLGALVAAQVGPIWLMLARTALRYGFGPGAAIGLGASLVDTGYAALGALGAAPLLAWPPARLTLGLAGAALLVILGAHTLLAATRVSAADPPRMLPATTGAAFRTSILATLANPLTIATWAAVFSAASTAQVADGLATGVALVAGVAVGSTASQVGLAAAMSLAGNRLPARALVVTDVVAGAGLVVFGLLLAVRSATG